MDKLANFLEFSLNAEAYIIKNCSDSEKPETCDQVSYNTYFKLFKGKYIPDLYLPNGCDNLKFPENTLIEIKPTLRHDTLYRLNLLIEQLKEENTENVKKYHFVIIYNKAVKGLDEIIKKFNEKEIFEIIQYDKLIDGSRNIKKKESICFLAFSKPLDNTNFIKRKAYKKFSEGPNTLFLGAGVSMDAGLPSWNTLLEKLIQSKDCSFRKKINYENLFKESGYSAIIAARYIREFFKDNKSFINAIYDIFYKQKHNEKSETVNSICNLVLNEKDKVKSIITYNYDDIIEYKLKEIGVNCYSVFNNNNPDISFPVCHVHGILPRDKEGFEAKIVLSEDDYHEIYKRAYHWSNIEQLHALQRTNCFFIGLSMTDPNLRRLLEISQGEESGNPDLRHFAFLKRNANIQGITDVDEFYKHEERLMNQLGVGIIWYDNYENLYKEIDALHNANKLLSVQE